VVVAGDRDVHQLPPGHRHRGGSCRIRGYCTPVSYGSRGRPSRIMPVLLDSFWIPCSLRASGPSFTACPLRFGRCGSAFMPALASTARRHGRNIPFWAPDPQSSRKDPFFKL
jgi:hypothetical protein